MKINFARAGRIFLLAGLCVPAAAEDLPAQNPSGIAPLEWSVRLAESEMARRGDSLVWEPGGRAKLDYTAGLFTLSLLKLNEKVPVPGGVDFAKQAIGSFISADGKIQGYQRRRIPA